MNINETIKSMIPFFDNLGLPVAVIDTSGRYIYYNQESSDLDNIPINMALGKNLLDIYPLMNKKNSTMLLSALRGLIFKKQKTNYTNYVGDEIDYTHSTAPIYDDNYNLIGAVEIGITYNVIKKNNHIRDYNDLFYSNLKSKQHSNEIQIIYESNVMVETIDMALKIAKNNIPVMIYGETGSGKELFAHLIHDFSSRKTAPFIAINCASIPESLIESLMFGTEKGAFTGAEYTTGFIEKAEGGTLFLDEFNSMSPSLQPKLLRYLQDGSYWKIGGDKEKHSNVRIIAAVNKSPIELVQLGEIRQDLYYRLCVGYLRIPPLRERGNDISLLIHHFLNKYRVSLCHSIQGCTQETIDYLTQQNWPGNVRMLENTIIRSIIKQSSPGKLEINNISMLPELTKLDSSLSTTTKNIFFPDKDEYNSNDLNGSVCRYEKGVIKSSYESNRYCLSKTARCLGMKRSTLQYKIKKYGL